MAKRRRYAGGEVHASDNALLSKLLRGEPVSVATLRRIGRALHCLEQPRKMHRVLTPQEAAAWDALPPAERLRRLQNVG